jgi:hypothetical protein
MVPDSYQTEVAYVTCSYQAKDQILQTDCWKFRDTMKEQSILAKLIFT